MSYVLLIIGFVFLIKGADYFVEGASTIAEKLKVPSILIGLTIVAFGTSAPELAVSIKSGLAASGDIAAGNVLGSNIFNLLLVIGVVAIIKPIKIEKGLILKEFPLLLLSAFVPLVLFADVALEGAASNILSRENGIILITVFCIYMYYVIETGLKSRNTVDDVAVEIDAHVDVKEDSKGMGKEIIFGIIGLLGVIIGGDIVVESSKTIAMSLGMSEALVGLTIVAVGTSLPELVTSIVAATKGDSDMAVGNVIGSNIFNSLLILGTTSLISPVNIESKMIIDAAFVLVVSFIVYVFAVSRKKVTKVEGILLAVTYIGYMVYIIGRN